MQSDLPAHIKSDILALSVCLAAISVLIVDQIWKALF
jgi:hypothetical protein